MMGLEPGEKIRILKENRSFFPGWWGKGRFTAFSCHNRGVESGIADRILDFFFFFFFLQKTNPIFSHSAQMQLQGRGGCASGRGRPCPPAAAAGEALLPLPSHGLRPSSLHPAEQMPKPGTNTGSAKAKEKGGMVKAGGDPRQGPGACFPALGRSHPALGTAPHLPLRPSGIAWV